MKYTPAISPMVNDYVRLADEARWNDLLAVGWTGDELVTNLLRYIDGPVDVDDYERFIEGVRALPSSAWIR
jgi:hypothetical protein